MRSSQPGTVESARGDWSCPSPGLVENLVAFLKKTHGWRLLGRSLRLLNKNWHRRVNRHIVEVRPHEARNVGPGDAATLSKFPSLTSLDASKFIGSANEKELEVVLDAISGLSELSRLEFSHDVFAYRYGGSRGILEILEDHAQCFGRVTSLAAKETFCDGWRLRKLARLNLEELSIKCRIDNLKTIPDVLPTLKDLNVSAVWYSGCVPELSPLSRLRSLKLHVSGTPGSLEVLSGVTSLVSLNIIDAVDVDFGVLSALPLLESLSIPVESVEALQSASFAQLLKRLKHLALDNGLFDKKELVRFVNEPLELQSLELIGFRLSDSRQLCHLARLTNLCVINCGFSDGAQFLESMPHLERLCSVDNSDPSGIASIVPFVCESLPNLRTLTIECEGRHLKDIARLHRLQTLGLVCLDFYSYDDRQHLEGLSRICQLELLNRSSWNIRRLLDLKLLTGLESLRVYDYDIEEHAAEYKRRLKQTAPHLKVDFGSSRTLPFASTHQTAF